MPLENKLNNDLYIVFFHPTLSVISEKTFRRLLKDIAKICHKALEEELAHVMSELRLEHRQKQSVKSKILRKIDAGSFYYFENFKRGSALVEISITGLAIWLLNVTLSEPIKAAARKSLWSKKIEEILSKKIIIKNYLKSRPPKLAEIATKYIDEEGALNRFEVESIEHKTDAKYELYVTLRTEEKVDTEAVSIKYDNNLLYSEIQAEIEKLKKRSTKEKNKDTDI